MVVSHGTKPRVFRAFPRIWAVCVPPLYSVYYSRGRFGVFRSLAPRMVLVLNRRVSCFQCVLSRVSIHSRDRFLYGMMELMTIIELP